MKKAVLVALAMLVVAIAAGALAYPSLPDLVPSHWNAAGEVEGMMPRFWGVFLLPIIMACALALFWALPGIDPLKRNYAKFRGSYDGFIIAFSAFMLYVQLLIIGGATGIQFNMTLMLLPALALLFYWMGVMLPRLKMNWFIGIRTPWTLSSKKVWDKTHKLGGKLFRLAGFITIISILFGEYAIWVMLVPLLAIVAYLVVYSYVEFRKS